MGNREWDVGREYHLFFSNNVINACSMKTCVLLHFEHKNDITVIVKTLYRAASRRRVAH